MKPPAALDNLYRDLRDKRLLPLVLILVVALIAIPVLLSSDDPPPLPTSTAATDALGAGEGAEQIDPVVLTEVPGIRDYKKRLSDLNKKNPFRQQLTGPTRAEQKALAQANRQAKQQKSAAAGGPGAGSSAAAGNEQAVAGGGETADAAAGGSTGSGSRSRSGSSDEVILFSYEIDVKVGPVGDTKKLDGVKRGQFLPGKKRPIAIFLDADVGAGIATFAVSGDVVDVEGKGECLPKPDNCQYLVLSEGQEQRFTYQPDGKTYRLKLNKVKLVEKLTDRGSF